MENNRINILPGKKIFFASDFHLGLGSHADSLEREKIIIKWLKEIRSEAGAIFLLGDVFDYWYEFRRVAPLGFVRFLGEIAAITDSGVPVYFFTGNHDLWTFGYLEKETGMQVIRKGIFTELYGKAFYIGHGDGLGTKENRYRLMKSYFTCKPLQWLFSKVHPDWNLKLGHTWSRNSRLAKGVSEPYMGKEKEYQIEFAQKSLKSRHTDFFIMGHRHLPMDVSLSANSRFIGLGEWINACTYSVFDGQKMSLVSFTGKDSLIYKE